MTDRSNSEGPIIYLPSFFYHDKKYWSHSSREVHAIRADHFTTHMVPPLNTKFVPRAKARGRGQNQFKIRFQIPQILLMTLILHILHLYSFLGHVSFVLT